MNINIECRDAIDFLRSLPPDSLSLVFGSPPYEQARLYLEGGINMGISRKTDAWVAWMVEVYRAAQAACKGLVAFVVAGQTRSYRWSAGPALLMAELHRAGMNLRNPPIFHRVGIPGSGGPDWLRSDLEFVVCTTRPGRLPWSNPTICGHAPKWAPGGAMTHQTRNGRKVAKLHTKTKQDGSMELQGYKPPALANPGNRIQCTPSEYEIIYFLTEYAHASGQDPEEVVRSLQASIRAEKAAMWCVGAAAQIQGAAILRSCVHGRSEGTATARNEGSSKGPIQGSTHLRGNGLSEVRSNEKPCPASCGRESDEQRSGECGDSLPNLPHDASQPDCWPNLPDMREEAPFVRLVRGSLLPLQEAWRSAEEMSQQSLWHRGISSNLISIPVGGGQMGGDVYVSQNEAPFPEALAEFFVLSFAPPGGLVCDPFSGSGTVAAMCKKHGRNFTGCDLRPSQVDLAKRRVDQEQPLMFI